MPRAKRSIHGEVTIDGVPLNWHLHREQQGSEWEGWQGLSIHVRVVAKVRRELFLEYPAISTQKAGRIRTEPARPAIVPVKVESHIREAMAAGWNPESRGKPFVYEVAQLPN